MGCANHLGVDILGPESVHCVQSLGEEVISSQDTDDYTLFGGPRDEISSCFTNICACVEHNIVRTKPSEN